jgi:hypothetical protein
MSDIIASCACGWSTKAVIPDDADEPVRTSAQRVLDAARDRHVLDCPKAGTKKVALFAPPHFPSSWKYQRALEEHVKRIGVEVKFSSKLGSRRVVVTGNPENVDALLASTGNQPVSGDDIKSGGGEG